MRWFTAYVITAVLVGFVAGLFWLRQNQPFGIEQISAFLTLVIPDIVYQFVRRFSVLLIFGCWSLVGGVLSFQIAYTNSETHAAPRGGRSRTQGMLEVFDTLFHNPTRRWLSSFTALLGILIGLMGAYIFWFSGGSVVVRLLWGLTALFGTVLVTSMAWPDSPHRLRVDAESTPDPMLIIPDEED